VAESEKREHEGWQGGFHSLLATFQENLLELEQQRVVYIAVRVLDQMHHLGYGILSFVELPGVLLAAAIFLVLQKRHDELDELVDGLLL